MSDAVLFCWSGGVKVRRGPCRRFSIPAASMFGSRPLRAWVAGVRDRGRQKGWLQASADRSVTSARGVPVALQRRRLGGRASPVPLSRPSPSTSPRPVGSVGAGGGGRRHRRPIGGGGGRGHRGIELHPDDPDTSVGPGHGDRRTGDSPGSSTGRAGLRGRGATTRQRAPRPGPPPCRPGAQAEPAT